MRAKLSVPNKLQANLPRKTSIYAVLCHTMNYSYIKIIKNDSIRSDADRETLSPHLFNISRLSFHKFTRKRKQQVQSISESGGKLSWPTCIMAFVITFFRGYDALANDFTIYKIFRWLFSHCINLPIRIIEPFFFLQFDKRMIDRSNRNQSHHQQSMYKICNNCAVAWSQHMINSLQFWMD